MCQSMKVVPIPKTLDYFNDHGPGRTFPHYLQKIFPHIPTTFLYFQLPTLLPQVIESLDSLLCVAMKLTYWLF